MAGFGALFRAVSGAVDGWGAVAAARASFGRGEPLESVVRAFAAETETTLDDRAVAELVEAIEQAVDALRRAAIVALRLGVRLEVAAPVWVARAGAILRSLEADLPAQMARARKALGDLDELRDRAVVRSRELATQANSLIAQIDAMRERSGP